MNGVIVIAVVITVCIIVIIIIVSVMMIIPISMMIVIAIIWRIIARITPTIIRRIKWIVIIITVIDTHSAMIRVVGIPIIIGIKPSIISHTPNRAVESSYSGRIGEIIIIICLIIITIIIIYNCAIF
jgi:hypothetical protein